MLCKLGEPIDVCWAATLDGKKLYVGNCCQATILRGGNEVNNKVPRSLFGHVVKGHTRSRMQLQRARTLSKWLLQIKNISFVTDTTTGTANHIILHVGLAPGSISCRIYFLKYTYITKCNTQYQKTIQEHIKQINCMVRCTFVSFDDKHIRVVICVIYRFVFSSCPGLQRVRVEHKRL